MFISSSPFCVPASVHAFILKTHVFQIWADEPSQKYKEGKSIIERTKVLFSKHEGETNDHCPISFADMSLDSEMEEDGC